MGQPVEVQVLSCSPKKAALAAFLVARATELLSAIRQPAKADCAGDLKDFSLFRRVYEGGIEKYQRQSGESPLVLTK